jgi:hypothetical protein
MYNYKWYNIQQPLDNREGYMPENAASNWDRKTVANVNIQHNIIKFVGPSLNTHKKTEITRLTF